MLGQKKIKIKINCIEMNTNEHTSYQTCGVQSYTWRETDSVTFSIIMHEKSS